MDRRTSLKTLAKLAAGTATAVSSSRGLAIAADRHSSDGRAHDEDESVKVSKWGTPTLGGMQFWADRCWLRGWKIQQHVYTHHCRVLNPSNGRHFSGSLSGCERALSQIREAKQLQNDTGKAVILIHGIVRSSRSFSGMAVALQQTHDAVIGFEYPSTRVPIDQSAEYLHLLIESLPEVTEIDFVVHSMGGLVVRSYLKHHHDPRLRRMVMLGTPNRGAELADLFQKNMLYRWVMGPAGQQITTDADGMIRDLPVPDMEFGVVAGGDGDDGFNPLLPGDDDGTVTVRSVNLPGAVDSLLVPRFHSFLMRDETVIAATKYFLQHGQFDGDRPPQPIVEQSRG